MDSVAFTGGLRVGESYWNSSNFTWPLAQLRVFTDRVEITGMFGCIRLQREQIAAVRVYRGTISDGVQFEHSSPNQQPFIVFWIKPEKVTEAFRLFGCELQAPVSSGQPKLNRSTFTVARFAVSLVLFFAFVLSAEILKGKLLIDAVADAIVFSLFIGIFGWLLRRRLVR